MLRQLSRKCILFLLILSLLCPSFIQAATGTLKANTGVRDEVCTALSDQAEAYYSGEYTYDALSALSGVSAPADSWATTQGNDLYDALQELMSSTQKTYPQYSGYYSDSLATYWLKTDAEAGSSSYLYFYTDKLSTEVSATMNREHIWPKANASYSQKNGGADLHHLRPSIESINSAKNNFTFADVVDNIYGYSTAYVSGEPVIWYSNASKVLEVRDNVKGDVARILLYVYCRWGQPNLYSDVVSSKLPAKDSDDSTNNGIRAIDDLDTLLRWCELDPVDSWEMGRNDQTENVQGNRNVFIDYPEFAWLIFNQTPPEDMATPSGEAANVNHSIKVTTNNSNYGTISVNENVITATPATGYKISGYTLLSGQATVVQEGNVFTVTARSDCWIRINFIPRSTVTLTFSDGTSLRGYAGDSFTLPSSSAPEGYEFMGWCTEQVPESASLPDCYTAGSSYTAVASTHFYALYSYSKEVEDETADYVKLTTAPSDWSGEYVIVYEANGYIFDSSLPSPNVRNNYKAVSIQDGRITAANADAYRVTIAPRSTGYSILTAANLYIGNTSTNSGLSVSGTTPYVNKLSMNADGTVVITATGGTTFCYYASTQRKFIYSNSASILCQSICLYRKDSRKLCTFYTTVLCLHSNTTETLVPATCEEAGSLTVICADCGEIMSSSVLPATGHTAVTDAAVAASCTEAGLTEGSHCSACAVVLVAQETVAALGHDYSYRNNGDGTHMASCNRCDATVTEAHSFTDGVCICGATKVVAPTVVESIKIYHTLNLASDISITFAVPKSALASYDSFYLECTLPEYKGNAQTGTSTFMLEPVLNGSYYYFTLSGITAVRMGDMVNAVLYMVKDGAEYISKTDSYSVATYAYAMLNSSSDSKMLTLCANLLRYGAEAQSFKNYRTDALVDANMTAAHRAYLSNTNTLSFTATDNYLGDLENASISWVGKTLDLGSKVGMKFVFNAKNYSDDIANLSMKVSYTGSTGESKTVTLTGAEVYSSANSYYSFTFYGLLASELRTVVDVTIYEGDTQLSETLRYSAESYASRTSGTSLAPLCKALFAYSDSAKAYFTK